MKDRAIDVSPAVSQRLAEWLKRRMHKQGITNTELLRRMRAKGFDGRLSNIANWRGGKIPVPMEHHRKLAECLEYRAETVDEVVRLLLFLYVPEVRRVFRR